MINLYLLKTQNQNMVANIIARTTIDRDYKENISVSLSSIYYQKKVDECPANMK